MWNNLPAFVVDADSVNSFKNRLDKFWQDAKKIYNLNILLSEIGKSRHQMNF